MIRPFGGIASLLFCDSMAKPGFISHKMKKKSFFLLTKIKASLIIIVRK